MTSQSRQRAIIVGAGLMGRWHAHALGRLGLPIKAIIDPELKWARALTAKHTGAKAADRLDACLAENPGAVVHICTPPDSHGDITRAALEAGCHALVEKPLTPESALTSELLDLAQGEGRLLCPVHQFPFMRGVLKARSRASTIAPIRHVEHIAFSAGAAGLDAEGHDRIAADIVPHSFSLFSCFLDKAPDEIKWQLARPAPGEIRAQGLAGEATAAITISTGGRPTTNRLVIVGERGTLHIDLFHGFCVAESPSVSRMRKIAEPFSLSSKTFLAAGLNLLARSIRREPAYPGLRELIRRFYAAAADSDPPPISPAETLGIARARDQFVEFVRENR